MKLIILFRWILFETTQFGKEYCIVVNDGNCRDKSKSTTCNLICAIGVIVSLYATYQMIAIDCLSMLKIAIFDPFLKISIVCIKTDVIFDDLGLLFNVYHLSIAWFIVCTLQKYLLLINFEQFDCFNRTRNDLIHKIKHDQLYSFSWYFKCLVMVFLMYFAIISCYVHLHNWIFCSRYKHKSQDNILICLIDIIVVNVAAPIDDNGANYITGIFTCGIMLIVWD